MYKGQGCGSGWVEGGKGEVGGSIIIVLKIKNDEELVHYKHIEELPWLAFSPLHI